ncbi:hypothetical protein ACHAXA_000589 [Cyclostephanos tholiformis]|uniref:RING-type domain-containing protein n=1 Tax=Cyclostephanos tholiformis TaxID=382380 RepID=A0ABD3SQM6_9STRA
MASEDDPSVLMGPSSGSEEAPTNEDQDNVPTTAEVGNIRLHFRLLRHHPGGTTRVVAYGRDASMGPSGMAHPTTMLPPLEPRPMPYHAMGPSEADHPADGSGGGEANNGRGCPINNNDDENDAGDASRFECAVCYEYMDDPFRCGNATCGGRFCRPCLQRVLRQSTSSGTSLESTDAYTNSARCPNCRSFFSMSSASADDVLRGEIRDCDYAVPCQFRGCGMRLRLRDHAAHESICTHAGVGCRYADWGCRWVGRRMDLAGHDANDCEFRTGLGVLVDRLRMHDVATRRALHEHRARIGVASQMIASHSRQIAMARAGRDPYNVFDVLRLAYDASLFPGRSATRGAQREEARCVVYNVLLLLPSLALAFNVAFRGLRLLFGTQFNKLSGDDMWFIIDALLLSIIVSMLGVLCVACFFIDNQGPLEWTSYNVRSSVPGLPMLRDLAGVCMAMLHFSSIEFLGPHPGLILWHCAAFVTIFHSSFVSSIFEKLAPASPAAAAPTNARTGRAWPVAVFGLRYGLLAAVCGFAPSINAVVALRLLRRVGAASSPVVTAEDSECFVTRFDAGLLMILSGFATAFVYVDEVGEFALCRAILRDWAYALATLAYANAAVYLLDVAGGVLGEKNFHMGNRMLARSQQQAQSASLPFIKPSPIGCLVCGACSFLMIIIATG